jgi:hypothetical protein
VLPLELEPDRRSGPPPARSGPTPPAAAAATGCQLRYGELRDPDPSVRRLRLVEREAATAAGAEQIALRVVDGRPAERDAREAAVERDGADHGTAATSARPETASAARSAPTAHR